MDSTIVTVAVGLISQYWGLNSMYTLYLSKSIDWVLLNMPSLITMIDYLWYLFLLVIPALGYILYIYVPLYIDRNKYIMTFYDHEDIRKINLIFILRTQWLELKSIAKGTLRDIESLNGDNASLPDQFAKFRIKISKDNYITGLIKMNYGAKNISSVVDNKSVTITKYVPYVMVQLLTTPIHISKFISLIDDKVCYYRGKERKNIIKFFGYHVLSYNKEKSSFNTIDINISKTLRKNHNPESYIQSYFYVNRDRLFRSVRSALAGEESWNAILYGPPGTGKSHLAEVLGRVLERNIVLLDLRYLKKSELMAILFKGLYLSGRHTDYSNGIYVLDEFDTTVKYLIQQEERDQADKNTVIDGKIVISPGEVNNDRIKLHDLLTIFQGPIPHPGLMIIATTNDLKYINDKLPALVRPGRMTPWKIGYINNDIFQQIIKKFFPEITDDKIDLILPVKHKISTQQILDLAKSSLGDYEYFKQFMTELIN